MHGTTFRALKVTCQVAAPGAESAVYDCLVAVVVSSTAGWECYHYVTTCCGSCRPSSDVSLAIISLATCDLYRCLQCFDAVGWAAGRASGL